MRKLVSCLIFGISITLSTGAFNFHHPPAIPWPIATMEYQPLQSIYLPHFHYIKSPPLPASALRPGPTIQGCFFYPCRPATAPNQWLSNSRVAPFLAPIPIQCIYRSVIHGPPGPPGPSGSPGSASATSSHDLSTQLPGQDVSASTSSSTNPPRDVIKSEVKTVTVTPSLLSGSVTSSIVERTTEIYTPTTFNIDLLGESDLSNDIKKESRSFLGISF